MAKKKKNPLGWKGQMILVCSIVMAVVFLPTTILLVVGMLPTLVAALVDRTRERVLGMTVGSMNLAGCTPFVIELWSGEHTPNARWRSSRNPCRSRSCSPQRRWVT
jgi:hypothetical protein